MSRFVIRNYGASKHLHHKDQTTLIGRDSAIETDDADFVAAISAVKELHIVDHGPEHGSRITPEPELKQLQGEPESIIEEDDVGVQEELENSEVEDSENQEQGQEDAIESYNDLTIVELKVIAKDRGIETKGLKKAEIAEALEKYDAEEVEIQEQFEDSEVED